MSGFTKLTVKALRSLAEEYEVQLPVGRITKNGLIKILQSENIQPPWDGPDWECPTPASLIKAGLLLGIAPRSIWRTVQASWPDYRGASGFGSVGVYRRDLQHKKLLHSRTGRITPAGQEILTGLQGVEKDPPDDDDDDQKHEREKALPKTTEELIDQVKEILSD